MTSVNMYIKKTETVPVKDWDLCCSVLIWRHNIILTNWLSLFSQLLSYIARIFYMCVYTYCGINSSPVLWPILYMLVATLSERKVERRLSSNRPSSFSHGVARVLWKNLWDSDFALTTIGVFQLDVSIVLPVWMGRQDLVCYPAALSSNGVNNTHSNYDTH